MIAGKIGTCGGGGSDSGGSLEKGRLRGNVNRQGVFCRFPASIGMGGVIRWKVVL